MWVLDSFTRPGKETLGAGNGIGTGGGWSRRAGAERWAAAGGTPPPTGAQLQTAAAAEPRRPPKKLLKGITRGRFSPRPPPLEAARGYRQLQAAATTGQNLRYTSLRLSNPATENPLE